MMPNTLDAPPTGRGTEPIDPPLDPLHAFTATERVVTLLFILAPLAAVGLAVTHLWGNGIHVRDVLIALGLYVATGYGVTVGYHRMLTHRSFRPSRALKIVFAIAGSFAFQGGPISWVADHRRHHRFSDRTGDPHSPHVEGEDPTSGLRGLVHAHLGWLLNHTATDQDRYVRDLRDDRDLRIIDALFPVWCLASLALPFALGLLIGGSWGAAATALLWAGGVRIFLLHHATWSINSICHMVGRRPFRTKDRSTNVAALAYVSLGESWHNGHHAVPRSARHGLLAGQPDPSAALIGLFERLGWVHDVAWPTAAQIETVTRR